jgi:3-hydroxyisobutyrate dehydrogenase-like beta-hydroxyacid dehydrogenase
MKVGVLGTGDVGKSLANAFIALNHEVTMGARDEGNPVAAQWAKSAGPRAKTGTFTLTAKSSVQGVARGFTIRVQCHDRQDDILHRQTNKAAAVCRQRNLLKCHGKDERGV